MAEEVLLNLLHSLSETLLQFVPVCVQVGGVGGVSGGWRDVEAVESRECRLQCFHDNLRLLCGGGHLRVDVSLERYFCPVLVEREADDVAQEPDESGKWNWSSCAVEVPESALPTATHLVRWVNTLQRQEDPLS